MKRIEAHTNFKIENKKYHFNDDIGHVWKIDTFGTEKVIEWINKHQKEFQETIDQSKELPILVSNLNSNAESFYPKNLKLLSDVAAKQNYLEQVVTNKKPKIINPE